MKININIELTKRDIVGGVSAIKGQLTRANLIGFITGLATQPGGREAIAEAFAARPELGVAVMDLVERLYRPFAPPPDLEPEPTPMPPVDFDPNVREEKR